VSRADAGERAAAAGGDGGLDERQLLARVAEGDRGAFRTLYRSYHRRLGGFLMRIVGRLDLTEEVINDTMFAVWCSARSFRGESRVSTWIMGIAYRQALKALRRNASRNREWSVDPQVAAESTDSGGTERRELRELIDRALASLPPKQRLVIELAYFMGHSCEEIASIVDCPVGTVKTRMHHARTRLRTLLPELSGCPAGTGLEGESG
jgi:RNA polymerase sigma-70 factor, ECF subfamily